MQRNQMGRDKPGHGEGHGIIGRERDTKEWGERHVDHGSGVSWEGGR
jgi:hypothetical protein